MHRHIIYIINPIAGTRTRKGLEKLIEETTRKNITSFRIYPSVASGDYSFLNVVIDEEKVTDVVIAGGDGTVSQVVGSLMGKKIRFGVIPCGSGNGLALAAGIPKNPRDAMEIILNGRAQAVDGFMVNGRFACMLCGLGFDAKVAHDFANRPNRGLNTYIKEVIRNFFAAKTYHFNIKVAGKQFETDAYFISIANSNQFGNNFTIAPKASLSDGLLDVVIVASSGKTTMFLQTLSQVAGWNKLMSDSLVKEKKGVIYFQTDKLVVSNPGEAPLHVDGDPAETPGKIKIEILKKCFRLIQP